MNLTTTFTTMAEVISRLKLSMPVKATLRDPISGVEFTVDRENILALLVVDTPNLLYESQSCSALFMDMARAKRACERAAAVAEREFVSWKAATSAAARSKSETKITDKAAEEAYRTHPDYLKKADLSAYYKTLADVFDDAMSAFQMKAKMIDVNSRILAGDLRTRAAERDSTESLEDVARGKLRERGEDAPPPKPRAARSLDDDKG